MSKYAPANDEGLKPYVLEMADWNRRYSRVVYAKDPNAARAMAGRTRAGFYVVSVRRALADEVSS